MIIATRVSAPGHSVAFDLAKFIEPSYEPLEYVGKKRSNFPHATVVTHGSQAEEPYATSYSWRGVCRHTVSNS